MPRIPTRNRPTVEGLDARVVLSVATTLHLPAPLLAAPLGTVAPEATIRLPIAGRISGFSSGLAPAAATRGQVRSAPIPSSLAGVPGQLPSTTIPLPRGDLAVGANASSTRPMVVRGGLAPARPVTILPGTATISPTALGASGPSVAAAIQRAALAVPRYRLAF